MFSCRCSSIDYRVFRSQASLLFAGGRQGRRAGAATPGTPPARYIRGRPGRSCCKAAAARAAGSLRGRRPCSRQRTRRRADATPTTRSVWVRRGTPCPPRPAAAAAACGACGTRGRRAGGWQRRCIAHAARAGRSHWGRAGRRGSYWPRRSVAAAAAAARAGQSNRGRRSRRREGGCCDAVAAAADADADADAGV